MNKRQNEIVRLLEGVEEISVERLVEGIQASEATIRRDLSILETSGIILRTYGGAKLAPSRSLVSRTFAEKRQRMRSEKERIALRAAGMIKPGMTITIDSGTACWRLAANLKEKWPLTVFTHSLSVIEELGEIDGMTIHCVGGRFRLDNLDFTGGNVLSAFQKLHSDIVFIGGDSVIPGKGVYSLDQESADIGEAIVNSSDKVVILADNSKFESRGHYKLMDEKKIDAVITDDGVDTATRKKLKNADYELIIA